MSKNHDTFWVVAGFSILALIATIAFRLSCFANDLGYDISLGIFASTAVVLFTVLVDTCTSRTVAIKRMLLEVRHIKALHNELCYAKTDAEIVRISNSIDQHFNYIQNAMASIEWILHEDIQLRELFNKICLYLMNTNPVLIASANKDSDKLEQAKLRSQCFREIEMYDIMEIWIPLVKKYDAKSLEEYRESDKWQNTYHNGNAYKTISDIEAEIKKEGK